jgi:hypothetical protein
VSELGIHREMRKVVSLALEAAKAELEATKRKLKKMQYGS